MRRIKTSITLRFFIVFMSFLRTKSANLREKRGVDYHLSGPRTRGNRTFLAKDS
jgi:hypothetical protein